MSHIYFIFMGDHSEFDEQIKHSVEMNLKNYGGLNKISINSMSLNFINFRINQINQ